MNKIQAQAEYQRMAAELDQLIVKQERVRVAEQTDGLFFGFDGYLCDPVELSDKIGALRASISQMASDIINGVYPEFVENNETLEEDDEVETYEIHMLTGEVEWMTEAQMEDYLIYTCCDCGELCEAETYQDTDKRMNILCNSCENDGSDYKLCSRCGYYEEYCIITEDSGQSYCNDCIECIYQCDQCGRYFEDPDSVHQDENNTIVCNHCYDYCDYVSCEECGRIMYSDDTYMHDGACYCHHCYCDIEERENDLSRWVHEWNYRPKPVFLGGQNKSDFRAGIELEIMGGNGREFCEETEDYQEIYLKHDGSLDDTGIEIVTHPMTMDYFNDEFPLSEIISAAKSNGFDSHNNRKCGLHVHVDRNCLGKTQIDQKYTIAKLLLLCERFFEDKLVPFSRRTEYQINQWCKKPQMNYDQHEDTIGVLIEKIEDKQNYDDRYQTVNLQNRGTIEFRIFRGSLIEQTVRAAVQLCEVLTNFAKNNDINKIQVCTWEEAVKSNHVELNAYMESRGLVEKVEPKSEDVAASVDFYTEQEIERIADNWENLFDSIMPYSEYVETLNQRETAHIICEDDSLIAPLDYIEASQIRPIDSIDVDSLFEPVFNPYEPQSSNELDQLAIGL